MPMPFKRESYFAIKSFFKPPLRLFLISLLLLANGCAPYKVSTQAFLDWPKPCIEPENYEQSLLCENKRCAVRHWLYRVIPRHRCQIRWYDLGHWTTWMLFGNDDDGIFGEEMSGRYRPYQKVCFPKALAWTVRNPLHNFCFYVIGSADRRNSEITLLKVTTNEFCMFDYVPQGKTVFASPQSSSSLFLGLHGGKPFFSLRLAYHPKRHLDLYIGWRCRGNFGLKFLPATKTRDKTKSKSKL